GERHGTVKRDVGPNIHRPVPRLSNRQEHPSVAGVGRRKAMGDLVRLDVDDGVGTIRLDRPPMNAINGDLRVDLMAVAAEAVRRDDVGAVVLYGGEKVFAAGADVKMMAGLGPEDVKPVIAELQEAFNLVEAI